VILCVGLILFAATALFPPWYGYAGANNTNRRSLGRSFLLSTPSTRFVHPEFHQLMQVQDARQDIERMVGEWVVIVSLTGLALLVVPQIIAAPAKYIGRSRRRRGRCVQCGYDLTGNESGVCPECGTKTSA
jgi:hypothetical protein